MTNTHRTQRGTIGPRALAALVLGVAGLVASAWWLPQVGSGVAHAEGPPAQVPFTEEAGPSAVPVLPTGVAQESGGSRLRRPHAEPGAAEALEREVPRGRFGPAVPDEGRTSSLEVRVTADGLDTDARATIVSGADAGTALSSLGDGVLTAEDLFPGRVVLELETSAGEAARREVLLRHRRRASLSLDFGDHGQVEGRVVDDEGRPVAGALVELDGSRQITAGEGRFRLPRRVSGQASITVSATGYARHRQAVGGLHGSTEPLEVRLAPSSRLVLTVDAAPGMTGEVELVIVPQGDPTVFAGGSLQSTYPWSDLYPLRVPVGGRLVLDDLPTCRVDVLAFHGLGRSRPLSGWCRPGVDTELTISWKPVTPLQLTVLRDGEPVPGCLVGLHVANPASDRVVALGAFRSAVDRFPLPLLPGSRQRVSSDVDGRALLGRDADEVWIEVVSEGGELQIVRRVTRGETALAFDLARPSS